MLVPSCAGFCAFTFLFLFSSLSLHPTNNIYFLSFVCAPHNIFFVVCAHHNVFVLFCFCFCLLPDHLGDCVSCMHESGCVPGCAGLFTSVCLFCFFCFVLLVFVCFFVCFCLL